jgi:hypothetical protein
MRFAAFCGGGVEVLDTGDVQDGATNPSLGKGLFVEIHPDHDVIAADDGNVMVRDGVLSAVGHGDQEWLEGHFVEKVSNLPRCNHALPSFVLSQVRPGPVRVFPATRAN